MDDDNSSKDMDIDKLQELLRIKDLQHKEALDAQKNEYERIVALRDEEIAGFVENLAKENAALKKQIIMLEIDIEHLKEKNQSLRATFCNLNKCDGNESDNVFYQNFKQIKENNDQKLRELTEKYDKLTHKGNQDSKQLLHNLRKIALEAKYKIIEDGSNDEGMSNDVTTSFESLTALKEKIDLYDNKIRTLQDELFNCEKYSILIQQKYEMLVEENKYLKKKIIEEKTNILDSIDEITHQRSVAHENLIARITDEINKCKESFEAMVRIPLKMKETMLNEMEKKTQSNPNLVTFHGSLKSENVILQNENQEMEKIVENKQQEIEKLENETEQYKITLHNLQDLCNKLKIDNEDLSKRTLEDTVKIAYLEGKQKRLEEQLSTDAEKVNGKNNILIEALHSQLAELEKKYRDTKLLLDETREVYHKSEKKVKELIQTSDDTQNVLVKLKALVVEKDYQLQTLELKCQAAQNSNDILKKQNATLSTKNLQLDEDFKLLQTKADALDHQLNSIQSQISIHVKSKASLQKDLEAVINKNLQITNESENLKLASQAEIASLQATIANLEKNHAKEKADMLNQTKQKEIEKANEKEIVKVKEELVQNELKDLKFAVARLYKTFKGKAAEVGDNQYNVVIDEFKMIRDIETGLDKLINTYISKEVQKVNDKMVDYAAELKALQSRKSVDDTEYKTMQKKLGIVAQIVNAGKASGKGYTINNDIFKSFASNGLYENLVIYLRNSNVRHQLEIFQLMIQKEQDIISAINESKTANISTSIKKDLNDLNASLASLKKISEQNYQELNTRSKNYISLEDFEMKIDEIRNITQNILDSFLNNLLKYKVDVKGNTTVIVFQISINEYNELIENISMNLDAMGQKISVYMEAYSKQAGIIEKAIDMIAKQTYVDVDVVSMMMKEKMI